MWASNNFIFLHLSFVLLLLLSSVNAVFCGSVIKYLPGYDGELPFRLETGYVTVGYNEIFYYFIESEGNPRVDPLLVWWSGGPGCSAFNGLIYEIGPLAFNITAYEGGIPTLEYYPYSWTKSASILFVDVPVGTGFSYSSSPDGWATSDTKSAAETYAFIKIWLMDHPQFLKVQLFIGADSYSGITAPIVVQHIVDGNRDSTQPQLNLKGYIVGCPRTDVTINDNSIVIFAHRMALISDELYETTKETCKGNYNTTSVENVKCYENLKLVSKCIKDINKNDMMEPKCTSAFPVSTGESDLGSLEDDYEEQFIFSPPRIPSKWCHNFNYSLSYVWANSEPVRNALQVRHGTVGDWKRCNHTLVHTADVTSSLGYHRKLSKIHLEALVYNGDRDFTIPNVGTQFWIDELNLKMQDNWRPWFVDGEVAGYTIKYSNVDEYWLTYATVKGAGHPPQEYKRRECYDMFNRWIHRYPI